MAKKKKGFPEIKADVDMTPIIDVCFNLLIFFMTSMKFKTTEGQIQSFLPKDQGQQTSTPQNVRNDEIRVKLLWVADDGMTPVADPEAPGMCVLKIEQQYFPEIYYDGDPAPSPDFRELVAFLQDAVAAKPDVPVIIDARTLVPWRYIVRALNACVEARVQEVKFAQPEIPY